MKMTMAWLFIYVASCVMSFVNPVFGLLGYMFEYYLRPSLHWWGAPLPDWRWNLTISVVLVASYLMRRNSLLPMPELKNPALKWIVGLVVVMLLVTPFAVDVDISWGQTVKFLKFLVVYFVIIGVVRTRWAFDAVVAVHMAGAAWWGWEQYVDPKRIASRLANVGSADTLNDNLAAAHLLTVIPFIFVYLLTAEDKRLRALALVAAPLVINLFILCNSRGGTIGLAVGTLAALLMVKTGHRLRFTGAMVAMAAAFFMLADPEFIARQQTTADYQTEGTAVERVESWRGGLALITDHPFGAGGEGYELLSPKYIPAIVERGGGYGRAPHNTYVLVAAEWGVLGLILYLGLIASTLGMLWRVRRQAVDGDGLFYRAFALQVGLIATLVASTFADRFYGESFYWMCGLAVALYRIQHAAAHPLGAAAPIEAATPADPRLGWWKTRHA